MRGLTGKAVALRSQGIGDEFEHHVRLKHSQHQEANKYGPCTFYQ